MSTPEPAGHLSVPFGLMDAVSAFCPLPEPLGRLKVGPSARTLMVELPTASYDPMVGTTVARPATRPSVVSDPTPTRGL